MNGFLYSVDETIDALLAIARARGTAMVAVHPICAEVDFVRGETHWYLDGDRATEQQVREAWAKARAARAVPAYERRERAAR
ncbi:hypothetical protein NE850_23135 [Paraburkholderia sp. USG1]|uniref:hypothetical protein n=1 Tax=Paraburkholderia sp. USG1 TaxID=2952268 RepID=UPI00286623E3|nr:hypothetical protein [Paraburkholderia sp. USG1]MDR8399220.1 hypothetical protein [Paraburkholderia sp. USG1]